jgi:hypothetical protein
MADLAEAHEMAHGVDYIVRCFALRFVDDEGAVEGHGLRLLGQSLVLSWLQRLLH